MLRASSLLSRPVQVQDQDQLQQTLNIDGQFRVRGVSGDLFNETEVDLTPDPALDEYFMVGCGGEHKIRPVLLNVKNLQATHWYLHGFNYNNMLIAGGAISNLLYHSWDQPNDVDIFLYGLTPIAADQKVKEIIHAIQSIHQLVSISKLTNVISIKIVQPDDDAAVATAADDVNDDVVDSNVDDDVVDSNVDDKHTEDGDLVSPNVTLETIKQSKWNFFEFQIVLRIYSNISEILHGFDLGSSAVGYDGTHIYFTTLSQYSYANSVNILDVTRRSTTYEQRLSKYVYRGFDVVLPHMNTSKIGEEKHINLPFCSLNKIDDHENWSLVPIGQKTSDYGTNFSLISCLQEENWSSYHSIITSVTWLFYRINKTLRSLTDKFRDGTLDAKTVVQIFGLDIACEYLKHPASLGPHIGNLQKINITELIPRYLTHAKSTFYPLKWMTENPGTQLTSSFNPVLSTPEEWYGEWYQPLTKKSQLEPHSDVPIERRCVICLTAPKFNKILIPCGHTTFCEKCLKKLSLYPPSKFIPNHKQCPICNQKIKMVCTVY